MARQCLSCGAGKGMTRFGDEAFAVEHAGITSTVEGLSGWRCGARGEEEFYPDNARRYAAAGDVLVLCERELITI